MDELGSLKMDDCRKEDTTEKKALTKLVDWIVKLYPLLLTSDRNQAMQKRFLKRTVSGTLWALYADK